MERPDSIDRILQDDAAKAIADEGFTLRVMRALPHAPVAERPWLKPVLMLGGTMLGCLLAAAFGNIDVQVGAGFVDLARSNVTTSSAAAALAMIVTLVVAATVLATDD